MLSNVFPIKKNDMTPQLCSLQHMRNIFGSLICITSLDYVTSDHQFAKPNGHFPVLLFLDCSTEFNRGDHIFILMTLSSLDFPDCHPRHLFSGTGSSSLAFCTEFSSFPYFLMLEFPRLSPQTSSILYQQSFYTCSHPTPQL